MYFLVALPSDRAANDAVRRWVRVYSGISNPHRDWIDRAVPDGAEVSVLWTGEGDIYPIWQNEFFSRSVGTIYSIAGQLLGALPQTRLSVDEQAGLLRDPDGRPVRPRYLLVDDSFTPAGRVLARDEALQITLYELEGPLSSAEKVTGLYGDTWSGAQVTYTRHDCVGGTSSACGCAAIRASSPSRKPFRPGSRGRRSAALTFKPNEETELFVAALQPREDECVVEFSVSPTGVPAELTHGGNPDTRVLGVHFDRFDYSTS